ncbi:hypothetical protein B5F07_19430 [Lachnoclostridium sp. An169]|uniref:ATP-binding protein n=1 Tax=Lachnoclostridium sp. An169 TaxID=1965569 RepID=UPI000B3A86CF|nr:ATP-binding protein [Lachnoclostridium sp. An169]OUP80929.1 hypothetical protein B5F07_19430 [Lachnoclostridium sp. An169]
MKEGRSLELGRLILEGQNKSFEEIVSARQELTFAKLEEEFVRTMGITRLNKDILKTLELYSDKNGYNNAAALLADENDFKGVDIIRFGNNIDEILDRETLEGISILTQFSRSIEMYCKYYQYEKIDGTERRTIEKVPEKAFREAIANALVHRLWDVNASIKVSMFPDRIEISSPGGLPAGISREEYLNGQISIFRNPIIGNVFFRLKYIEKFGTGILRINQAYAEALEKPEYRIFDNSIQIMLPVIMTTDALTENEKIIYVLIRDKGVMTRNELTEKTGMGKDMVLRVLNSLLEKNIIRKKGMARGTKYEIM